MKFLKFLATAIVVFTLIGVISMGLIEKINPGEIGVKQNLWGHGGIDDEVAVSERLCSHRRLLEAQVRADLRCVAGGHLRHRRQPLRVYVHESHLTTLEVLREA